MNNTEAAAKALNMLASRVADVAGPEATDADVQAVLAAHGYNATVEQIAKVLGLE